MDRAAMTVGRLHAPTHQLVRRLREAPTVKARQEAASRYVRHTMGVLRREYAAAWREGATLAGSPALAVDEATVRRRLVGLAPHVVRLAADLSAPADRVALDERASDPLVAELRGMLDDVYATDAVEPGATLAECIGAQTLAVWEAGLTDGAAAGRAQWRAHGERLQRIGRDLEVLRARLAELDTGVGADGTSE